MLDLVHLIWTASITDFDAAYREVAEGGFGSIVLTETRGPFSMLDPVQAREARRLLDGLGLAAHACHGADSHPCDLGVGDAETHATMIRKHATLMTNVAELGARTYVVHLGPKPPEDVAGAWERVRRAVDELAPMADRLGVKLALENGMQTYLASNDELLAFVAEYAHPAVGICYDSGHAHVMGDAPGTLDLFREHVVTVHLHDNDGTSDQHLVPGQGTLDWPPVAAVLRRCPRLVHIETEAGNCPQWPPSHAVISQAELYQRYLDILNPPGAEPWIR